jgi:hypothetical protein
MSFLCTPKFSGMQLGRKVRARCTVCASVLKVDATLVFSALAARNCQIFTAFGVSALPGACLPPRYSIDRAAVWRQ